MSLRASIFLCFLLGGCGFQTVYGDHSQIPATAPIRAGVNIQVSADSPRNGQLFHDDLEDLINPLGSSAKPAYTLNVVIAETTVGIGVARDGTASRYNLVIDSNYTITPNGDKKILTNGTIRSVTSYNNPNNRYFSIYVSEQDARTRGIAELAELYRQRLASYTEKTMVPQVQRKLAPPALDPLNPFNPLNPSSLTTPLSPFNTNENSPQNH